VYRGVGATEVQNLVRVWRRWSDGRSKSGACIEALERQKFKIWSVYRGIGATEVLKKSGEYIEALECNLLELIYTCSTLKSRVEFLPRAGET
jgi:hypothetical protein